MSTEAILTAHPAPAERFEECLASLQRIVEASGAPVEALRNHPAVRPLLKEMRSLLVAGDAPEALSRETSNAERPSAQVIDLAAARARRR